MVCLPALFEDDFRPDLRGVGGDTIALVGGVGAGRGGDGAGVILMLSLFFNGMSIVTLFLVLNGFSVINFCFRSYFKSVRLYVRSFLSASIYGIPIALLIDLPLIILTRSFIYGVLDLFSVDTIFSLESNSLFWILFIISLPLFE